ncbi:hypothetical protein A966_06815 [Brachyspira hampsonii 30446]|uniref:Surface antigen BspA-like protein n=2 Tax=Brachyspira hampsonii TaxID=1287055 RepID=A0A2U4F1P4_9SPIR|nr:leucine-rich repeat domain-containing protein [Brachyspira hampsonii]EKV57159.1 hypothetical protein A966_06815 [Brachyspira hampsonii 30446]OEJ20758.1 hypothetical protein A9495_10425 [Brachyspira hampsonii]
MFKIKLFFIYILFLISCSNYKATSPLNIDYNNNQNISSSIPENIDEYYIIKSDTQETEIENKMQEYFDKYGYYAIFLQDTGDNIDKNSTIETINKIIEKTEYSKYGVALDISRTTVTEIKDNAFKDNNNIAAIKLPETIKTIGESAFENCSTLSEINFPSSIETIKTSSFNKCIKLTKADLSKTKITAIANKVFYNCISLTSVVLPDTLTIINIESFAYCYSLYDINFTSKLTYILPSAFISCKSLTKISLPSSLKYIYGYSFGDCSSLSDVEYLGDNVNNIQIKNGNVFDGYVENSKPKDLYLPNASSDSSWESFFNYTWEKDKIFYGKNMP